MLLGDIFGQQLLRRSCYRLYTLNCPPLCVKTLCLLAFCLQAFIRRLYVGVDEAAVR